MTAHLMLFTLGPVQEFIAQARRTRDLWYGSHLLSELSRAAARALVAGGAKLIFPALTAGDAELVACLAPLRPPQEGGNPPQNIANKLLAEVPEGTDPHELAKNARKSVADFWRNQIAASVKSKCADLLAPNVDAVWNEQIDSFLEFAATWLPLSDYAKTRSQLEQAISGRKVLRDFDPWEQVRGNVPKSSLDGARESVLRRPSADSRGSGPVRDPDQAGAYRIADGEHLDAVGLVKRAGGEPDQFVPVVNVALASWLERAQQIAAAELNALKIACRDARVSPVARPDLPCVSPFAFDGSVLLANRWRPVFKEQGLGTDAMADKWGSQHVKPLLKRLSEPYPYVACLVADGDHMGRAINRLSSATAHRDFSKALSSFASSAREIVEQQHRGALVYAGGDDVLAFVSLPKALACAVALREAFETTIATACPSLPAEERPSMSVGLGIGHVMESMGDLLSLGRQAEREAKIDRNTLAVMVDKRSGGMRTWRAQWNTDPANELSDASELLQSRMPSRKVFEIAKILAQLPMPGGAADGPWSRVLALEVKRALSRVEGGGLRPEELGLCLDPTADYSTLRRSIDLWLAKMLIARTFRRAAIRESRTEETAA